MGRELASELMLASALKVKQCVQEVKKVSFFSVFSNNIRSLGLCIVLQCQVIL